MELTTSLTLTVILVYVMEVVYSLFFVHCFASSIKGQLNNNNNININNDNNTELME